MIRQQRHTQVYFAPSMEPGMLPEDLFRLHGHQTTYSIQHRQNYLDFSLAHSNVCTKTIRDAFISLYITCDEDFYYKERATPLYSLISTSGVLTLITPKQHAEHWPVVFVGYTANHRADGPVDIDFELRSSGEPFGWGDYTIKNQHARVRIDQGDGTFVERPLYYDVPFEEYWDITTQRWQ